MKRYTNSPLKQKTWEKFRVLGPLAVRTHGMSTTTEYRVWWRMLGRCTRPNESRWYRYGGRGIKVCERWLKFENFYSDMGPRPKGRTLDRINNDGNYEPGNCRWATREQQENNKISNRFITHDGKTLTLAQWSRLIGVNRDTISNRIDRYGWTVAEALTPALWKGHS